MSSFCSAKATHIFSAKNIRILYIESAKTVNEMTLNKLVKLTTLCTTGPRMSNVCNSCTMVYVGLDKRDFRIHIFSTFSAKTYEPTKQKCAFGLSANSEGQIRLHGSAVYSGHSLYANRDIGYYIMCKKRTRARKI